MFVFLVLNKIAAVFKISMENVMVPRVNVCHPEMVKATGVKIVALRTPSMACPTY
jgi:hypothetical protein